MATIRELVDEGRRRLHGAVTEAPGREARLLLGHVLGRDEVALLTHDDCAANADETRHYRELLSRRERGEPAAYLLGRKEFFGRDFAVDERVLIPRPETEAVVEIALGLAWPEETRALDVGTGSGAIALTLAAERPRWRLVATDLSLDALACARRNRSRLDLEERVALVRADVAAAFDPLAFDLVVSNPPYVDPAEPELVAPDVRTYEPHLALFAEDGGLAVVARLVALARSLREGAFLVSEFGFGQRDRVLALAAAAPELEVVEVRDDAAGIPRVVVFNRTGRRDHAVRR